ncbi:MAG: pseudouridine-5'-phosphate glycosidase [Candidatus Marinimicrobia bacterium]|mgnify:CR=1 FL=1|jgi:pseudouridine-5'-phosphate glycosidase|nr:pseudouridine-5'-phosphate glycosidase [Candidatus Neomarinimicrobiota bacterium]MBT3840292.1 pseudouridine-5'-phosphate glycosidase [Candidatus Neomarinimicrobiota bacterium]MBT4000290.1 pseudouridine-5'-phosphate glycosidase [Candidatus Neomarinimicrobiota bacterium]MBT4382620.1 pseudouridine-5'-phosphate glycosidase [Candidatus Neomarinimicrobiota bacterium]MBT4578497.1 pseudouridine-5'-phosphate glycosidase [Candidatus Neomarinimicrobiota bacterium]
MKIKLSKDVQLALELGQPILVLESTIIAHGMPYPDNLEFAKRGERLCKENNVIPATIAIINGEIFVGLENDQLTFIAENDSVKKVSRRELGIAVSEKWNGATTVSSTMHIAHQAGLPIFSTGGIGGVHRGVEFSFDISQDLTALATIPMVVISAGAKAILDLSKTLEMMETLGITVVGYHTNELPAFYSRSSGIFGIHSVSSSQNIANIYKENIAMALSNSVLVVNPVPEKDEIPTHEIKSIIETACETALNLGIAGKKLTPFLLKEIVEQTAGRSLKTNKALALNNIKLGIEIAKKLS